MTKFDVVRPMLIQERYFHGYNETKLSDSFPVSQFRIEHFSMKLNLIDINGDIVLYIRSYIIASKFSSFTLPNDKAAPFVEINVKVNK